MRLRYVLVVHLFFWRDLFVDSSIRKQSNCRLYDSLVRNELYSLQAWCRDDYRMLVLGRSSRAIVVFSFRFLTAHDSVFSGVGNSLVRNSFEGEEKAEEDYVAQNGSHWWEVKRIKVRVD